MVIRQGMFFSVVVACPDGIASSRLSANPWQLFPCQPIDDAPATQRGRHLHEVVIIGDDCADPCRPGSVRVHTHG
jgi:hypothetical protein